MSSAVTGRSRERSMRSSPFELIKPCLQSFSLKIAPDLAFVNPGKLQEKSDIGQILQSPCRIVLHRVDFHRGQVLGSRNWALSPGEHGKFAAAGKKLRARLSPDVDEV